MGRNATHASPVRLLNSRMNVRALNAAVLASASKVGAWRGSASRNAICASSPGNLSPHALFAAGTRSMARTGTRAGIAVLPIVPSLAPAGARTP